MIRGTCPSWLAAVLVAALLLLPGAHFIAVGGMAQAQNPICPADTLLVMGAAQYDGEPSPAFARRLDKALGLYRAGCAPYIVVTGGKQPGDRFTEGASGVQYLLKRGVPAFALAAETTSRSSLENLQRSRPLLRGTRLLIVTDDLHAYRTELLAQHLGLEARVARVTTSGPRLRYALHEAAGVMAFMLGIDR